jgi:hypothetical protein
MKVTVWKRRSKRVPVLGAAGLSLSLCGGAPAATGVTTADVLPSSVPVNHEETLCEEEITDVSLSQFHIWEGEITHRVRMRIAAGAACGGCGPGFYSSQPTYNGPASGMPPAGRKLAHPYVHALKRPQVPGDKDRNPSRIAKPEADTLTTNQNTTRQAEPKVDGLEINQSAGQQAQPQVASPVIDSGN